MELLAQQRDLQAKIPDIEKCLDAVATFPAKKGTGQGIPLGEKIFLKRDVNGRVGRDTRCMKDIGEANTEGKTILDFSQAFDFTITNTCFKKKLDRKFCLDYIVILEESLMTQLSFGLLIMDVRVKRRVKRKGQMEVVWACVEENALTADFEVSEGMYSRARIEEIDSVCLCLGANVMLEYSLEEATDLLQKNLDNAKGSLEVLVADLHFLRDQVTITQVTIARVYNWDVHQRRLRHASATPAQD
ncbi:hypothetical protein Lal_00040639 [Lupinus albus]|nr:hypothetical protein Lal_00040639 [Lupinus albus]